MFASLQKEAHASWSKIIEFTTLAVAFIQSGVQRTVEVLAPVFSAAGMIAAAIVTSLAVAQAAQEAEVQAIKARVLAERLLTGEVALEDIDATVAAYRSYRVHAAASPFVWNLPSTAELRRMARARSLVRILLV